MIVINARKGPQEVARAATRTRDESVAAAAEAELCHSSYTDLRRVHCSYQHGTLTLEGRVTRYYLKQVAQSLVGRLTEVVDIDNRLDVVPFADRPMR